MIKIQEKKIASKIWQDLENAFCQIKNMSLKNLFEKNPERASQFSLQVGDIFLDYSKNFITKEILADLINLANECEMPSAIFKLMSGEKVNTTEDRQALHTALRQNTGQILKKEEENTGKQIAIEKEKMYRLVETLHEGYQGLTGKKITTIVNIGIGGSDLGPLMTVEALKNYAKTTLAIHFISNVDPEAISDLLQNVNPEQTMFILSSKSFSTKETLANAELAKKWLQERLKIKNVSSHFIAVTANPKKAEEFGIDPKNILQFWDWVGGRYSIWSSIGLPLAIQIGRVHFEDFLLGAKKMDEHFAHTPLSRNMPVLLGLIGIWYINFWQANTIAVLPYSSLLRHFPDYLQQLDMESNGKSVKISGESIDYLTGPIVWGQVGTNGQHAFYQLLHQGMHFIPIDFIVASQSHSTLKEQHTQLIGNCFAQSAALMQGKIEGMAHEYMPGNKPSNTLLLKKISPFALGQLIALYEHKVFVQGIIWGINSFDQPGVELGKKMANAVIACLEKKKKAETLLDPSSQLLIEKVWEFSEG